MHAAHSCQCLWQCLMSPVPVVQRGRVGPEQWARMMVRVGGCLVLQQADHRAEICEPKTTTTETKCGAAAAEACSQGKAEAGGCRHRHGRDCRKYAEMACQWRCDAMHSSARPSVRPSTRTGRQAGRQICAVAYCTGCTRQQKSGAEQT